MSKVLVVLTCWKRIRNMERIVRAWRNQSVPTHVIVIDNSPNDSDAFHKRIELLEANDVWRIGDNLGPVCRFAPALMLTQDYEYCMFADDDLVPGCRAVQTCIEVAKKHPTFATIGQHARNFRREATFWSNDSNSPEWRATTETEQETGERDVPFVGGNIGTQSARQRYTYSYGNPCPLAIPRPVDLTVRAHFFRTLSIRTALRMSHHITSSPENRGDPEVQRMCRTHDDFLLCCGAQIPSQQSLILPQTNDPERLIVKEDLDRGGDGLSKDRAAWLVERNKMLRLCVGAGWRSTR